MKAFNKAEKKVLKERKRERKGKDEEMKTRVREVTEINRRDEE